MYVMCATWHMYQYGTTSEQLAWIKVAASHAQQHPHAMLRADATRRMLRSCPWWPRRCTGSICCVTATAAAR